MDLITTTKNWLRPAHGSRTTLSLRSTPNSCGRPPIPDALRGQMASADEAFVVDAWRRHRPRPVLRADGEREVLKVFHAARQDIEIVWHRAKMIPHPVFDTQVAAMVLGYGDSISYDQLVQRITGDALDKSHRFTDWTRRPLSEAQIDTRSPTSPICATSTPGAAADLDKRGRAEWVRRGDGGVNLAGHLSGGAGACLAAAQDPRAQAEGARRPDGGRRVARARGAVPRRAARPRAQGRRDRRDRPAGADHGRAARRSALAAAAASSARAGARRSSRR